MITRTFVRSIDVTYGEYILSTGSGIANWEEAFGRYLFESRFRGRSPVLDIGPGRCWFTRQAPGAIVGLDTEPKAVNHYQAEGLDVRLGSVYDIPFPDQSVQGVFCCWLLEHLQEPDRALQEMFRVLAPGGHACVIVPSVRSLLKGFYDDFTHVRPFTEASLRQLADLCQIQDAKVEYLFWTRGGGWLLRMVGPDLTHRLLGAGDRWGRMLGLVNRGNLVLEFSR